MLAVLEAAPNGAQAEFAYLARRIPTSEDQEEHYRCAPENVLFSPSTATELPGITALVFF